MFERIKILFAIVCCLTLVSSQVFAQEATVEEQYQSSLDLTEAQLNQLESQIENGADQNSDFIFAIAIPSAMAATADLIMLAGAAGYISWQLQNDLNLRLNAIDPDLLSLRELFRSLKSIFVEVEKSATKTERNLEKLTKIGYKTADIEALQSEIASKSRMCSNKQNNNSPENFCPDFMRNFGRDRYKLVKKAGSWVVTKGGKFQCCLEWDSLHCGFEIFDKRGRHKGEVGCLADEFNPCDYNPSRGSHARPQTDHKPRSQACKK